MCCVSIHCLLYSDILSVITQLRKKNFNFLKFPSFIDALSSIIPGWANINYNKIIQIQIKMNANLAFQKLMR